jgi:hypothetical protein
LIEIGGILALNIHLAARLPFPHSDREYSSLRSNFHTLPHNLNPRDIMNLLSDSGHEVQVDLSQNQNTDESLVPETIRTRAD